MCLSGAAGGSFSGEPSAGARAVSALRISLSVPVMPRIASFARPRDASDAPCRHFWHQCLTPRAPVGQPAPSHHLPANELQQLRIWLEALLLFLKPQVIGSVPDAELSCKPASVKNTHRLLAESVDQQRKYVPTTHRTAGNLRLTT